MALLAVLSSHGLALAAPAPEPHVGSGGLSAYAGDVTESVNALPDIFNYVSYVLGALLGALGLSEAKHVVSGTGNVAPRQALAKLFFGGIFLGLPYIVSVAQATFTGDPIPSFTVVKYFKFGNAAIDDDKLSGMVANSINQSSVLVGVSAFLAFIMGVYLTMRGLQMLRAHIENPGNAPLPESLKRLAVGGALLSLPVIVNVVRSTFGVQYGSTGLMSNSGFRLANVGDGLDGMMVNFIQDISNAAYFGIEAFCYIAGVVMILFAMQRLVRSAQDGPRGPLGFGTITMFVVAGLLLSFPQFLTVLDLSVTGVGFAKTQVDAQFMSLAGADALQKQNAVNVFSAVLAFMAVVGFLSVVRGLFMLKALADGGQATMMQIVVHLVAGSLAINLGAFINAVQHSLGLSAGQFAVVFN